ncbi:bifunctional DNA primase/helicase [Pseudomonas frederiksbergensis]|uniref:toprim domain-containing protein n=1 Tax=Pseudomonas frederiksbergensis TaxID=104087 RepID=UPI0019809F5F|nr:toprim domain-containing protein [Pseudomonas frederiksbergensis]MBN3864631.1 bifunctional DNA primase/helicase [Pseudomonas frederiksbergensis]
MRDDLRHDVLQRLESDYGLKHRTGTEYMRGGECPKCHKRELYSRHDKPWLVICGRSEKCGHTMHVKEIYDDLFEDWSKRAPATDNAPTATARAYLEFGRGFNIELIAGWFTQETYYSAQQNAGSATVRFALEKGGYWERLIDKPARFGKMKARFAPGDSYRGVWWCPPCVDVLEAKEIWIVEGIFDAIALVHHNIAAVSAMSSNAFPADSLKALVEARPGNLPKLVWALDNEPGAHAYTKRWVRMARELGFTCEAAQIPQRDNRKVDWNDLHQRWQFLDEGEKRDTQFDKDITTARHHGALLIAENATEKAMVMFDWKRRSEFHLEYGNRLYWFKLDLEKYNKAIQELEDSDHHDDQLLNNKQMRTKAMQQCGALQRIATCNPKALYYQENKLTDESWYYFRITFAHDAAPIKNTFTSSQIASSAEFKKRLLGIAPGGMFTGTTQQLDAFIEEQTDALKTVQTIDFTGYTREHSAYVYGEVAVRDGKVFKLNEEDFFDMDRLSIKTLSQSVILNLNTDLEKFGIEWLDIIWQCFGAKGLVALAFWFGSLFAEQIRQHQKSYPFAEIIGEPGAGKSTLIEFLWKLCGRIDYEGFDPTKGTPVARARNFAQVGNLPVVLIESEREKTDGSQTKQYDWDELKTAYNGRSVRSTGVKNNGNDTREPPFRGAVVIGQNHAVNASEPILQRLVHIAMTKDGQTPQTKLLVEKLERMPVDRVSGFLVKATMKESIVMHTVREKVPVYEQKLLALPEIRTVRIAKNHAQLHALVDALVHVVPLKNHQVEAAHNEIQSMAKERQLAINADHPIVVEFWELYEYLNSTAGGLNHSRNNGLIAVNLNDFAKEAAEKRQKVPDLTELKRHLKTSKCPKFVETNRNVCSAWDTDAANKPKTVRCWIFQAA